MVATKSPVFPSAKVPASLLSIYVPTKPSPLNASLIELILIIYILTRLCLVKAKI